MNSGTEARNITKKNAATKPNNGRLPTQLHTQYSKDVDVKALYADLKKSVSGESAKNIKLPCFRAVAVQVLQARVAMLQL